MESVLSGIEISQGAIECIAATVVVLFLMPIVVAVLWKRRCGQAVSFAPLVIGAAGFLVSARVLELGVHMVCIVSDNPVSRAINGSTVLYVLYGISMAGIFEECGRYIVIRFLMKKNKTRENMVMYGIGHGGVEVWAVSMLSIASILMIVVLIQTKGIEEALPLLGLTGDVPEATMAAATATISQATSFGAIDMVLTVLERILAMTAHVCFTIIVAYGILMKRRGFLPAAILAHAGIDVAAALHQRGVLSMFATELWFCACVALLAVWGKKLYRAMEERE